MSPELHASSDAAADRLLKRPAEASEIVFACQNDLADGTQCMGPKTSTRVQAVLICGWQDTPFMMELLTDLDRGVDRCCSFLLSML